MLWVRNMPRWTHAPLSEPQYAPRLRAERLITGGRVVMAIASLFAVWLDPEEPIRYASIAYGVLIAYVIYSIGAAVLLARREAVAPLWPGVTHTIDLVCFSLFIFFTDPASPFTVYFVFALLSATLRWQVRGTLWTAFIVITTFFAFGIYFGLVLNDPEFELRGFILRSVYLFVLAALLGYVGTQDRRTVREMSWLAGWPETVHHDVEALTADLLAYTAALFEAQRIVLTWTETDSPSLMIAMWDRGEAAHERLPADTPVIAERLLDQAFIVRRRPAPRTLVQDSSGRLVAWPGQPLDEAFAVRIGTGDVLTVPLQGEAFEGRLFVGDKTDPTVDDLVLGEVVAGVISARLDAHYLVQQLRQASATEERIRLSRDLHDGVLQSFTGIALRLAAIRRMMDNDTPAAQALEETQRVLAQEQRDLRFLIDELKPAAEPAEGAQLGVRLEELARRMEREWDLRVQLSCAMHDGGWPPPVCRDVYHIVREALINAARHGAASEAQVEVAPGGGGAVAVGVADNGRGFPFTGRYSDEDLTRLNLGPKTLRERVRAVGGSLVLDTSPAGATLRVVLPRGEGV